MANPGLTARMKDHFERQIAYYEGMVAECQVLLETAIEVETVQGLAARQAEHSARLQSLGAEFRALLKEWQAADDLAEAERAAVGELAGQAEGLAARVSAANERMMEQAGDEAAALRRSWVELRRARGVLGKYRLGDRAGARFIDKKT